MRETEREREKEHKAQAWLGLGTVHNTCKKRPNDKQADQGEQDLG